MPHLLRKPVHDSDLEQDVSNALMVGKVGAIALLVLSILFGLFLVFIFTS